MTDKQIERMKETLSQVNCKTERDQLRAELRCRDMINSILCYNGDSNIMQNRYLQKYIDELGENTVKRLVDEQIEDFNKAIVKKNVYTDSEGLSYNSIIWEDEQ